jgi:T6SS, Phospholipase effector Tle1-like, catalytic domain
VKGAHEVWFRGVHSDIGGGDQNRRLNDNALWWMLRKAVAAGLPIESSVLDGLQPNGDTLPKLHNLPPLWRPMEHTDLRLRTSFRRLPGRN